MKNCWIILAALTAALTPVAQSATNAPTNAASTDIPPAQMQAIYDEVRTPYKYGTVLEPPPGKKVDCPNVFRHGDKWYMMYAQLEDNPKGYTTQLAESDDLVHWRPLGTILPREPGKWDSANAGGGLALFDPAWAGSNEPQKLKNHFWLTYMGGANPGYEKVPLDIGVAITTDPSRTNFWKRLPAPVLRHSDTNARPFETETLFKSYVMFDPSNTLGMPFVMFYNARPPHGDESIGVATSRNLKNWTRVGDGPVITHPRPPDLKYGTISGDPQVVRMNDLWVMFYFGAFWKTGAFDTFAASRNLTNWTTWQGEDLVKPSEPWDTPFAHKPWVIKQDGIVYHFYCAVSGSGANEHRAIALATSKDLHTPAEKK